MYVSSRRVLISLLRYRQLAAKERRLYDELIKVNREMTNLTSSMLDNVCDMEETMKTIYKTDYAKRGKSLSDDTSNNIE